MSLELRVHEAALQELADAIEWYNQGEQDRGTRFRSDAFSVMQRCLEWPKSGARMTPPDTDPESNYRHARVPRSHYRIIYVVDGDVLHVIAIAHERRMPRYWADRDQTDS